MKTRFRPIGDGRLFVPSRGQPPEPPEGYERDTKNPYMFRPKGTITNKETTDRELYQNLYDDPMLHYGSSEHNRCPGIKMFSEYAGWLQGAVIDLGCGRGDTVMHLREEGFYDAQGIDQISLANDMLVGDITQPQNLMMFGTSICIDVFEHIDDQGLFGLLDNMSQTKRQVISVHIGPAYERGCKKDLHINKKPFIEWHAFISKFLNVVTFTDLGKQRGIYLCTSR